MAEITEAGEKLRGEVDKAYSVGEVAVLVGRIHYRGRFSGLDARRRLPG